MSPFLSINEEIEQAALSYPAERWFTVATLNNDKHDSRCWLHFVDDLVQRHYKRECDNATLIQSQEDRYRFCWQKQPAS